MLPIEPTSSNYYFNLFNRLPDAILVIDNASHYIDANPAACTLTGYTRDELLRLTSRDITPPSITDKMMAQIREQALTGQKVIFDYPVRRKDGTLLDCEFNVVRDFEPGRHLAVIRDITPRKQMEAALRNHEQHLEKSEQFLRTIYEGAPLAIFVIHVSEDGDFFYEGLNPLNTRITRLRLEEVLNRRPEDIEAFSPEQAAMRRAIFQRCVESGQTIVYESRVPVDEQDTWWLTHLSPIRDQTGRIFRLIGISLNITQQHQMQQALAQSEQRLRDVTSHVRAIIFALDDKGVFTFSDGLALESIGLKPGQVVGMSVYDYNPAMTAIIPRVYAGQETYLQIESDGLVFDNYFTPIHDEHGNLTGINGISIDVTGQKQMENTMRQVERLETELAKEHEIADLMSRLFSMLGHEFKTPLTTLMNSIELLQRRGDTVTADYLNMRLEKMQRQIVRLSNLLNDFLMLNRDNLMLHQTQYTRINAREFISDIVGEIYHTPDLALSFDFQGDGSGYVTDIELLRRIVVNLVSNAVKYTQPPGKVNVQCVCMAQEITLMVQDTGIGIPEEDQTSIFEMFHRGSNTTQVAGTGIGMATVKKAVEMLAGSIRFTSRIGEGTTFIVTLPDHTPEVAAVE